MHTSLYFFHSIFILIYVELPHSFLIEVKFTMCNSVAVSTFPVLYSHHHCLTPEYFHHPKNKPSTQEAVSVSPLLALAPTNRLSVSMNLSILGISLKCNRITCALLCLASFT